MIDIASSIEICLINLSYGILQYLGKPSSLSSFSPICITGPNLAILALSFYPSYSPRSFSSWYLSSGTLLDKSEKPE